MFKQLPTSLIPIIFDELHLPEKEEIAYQSLWIIQSVPSIAVYFVIQDDGEGNYRFVNITFAVKDKKYKYRAEDYSKIKSIIYKNTTNIKGFDIDVGDEIGSSTHQVFLDIYVSVVMTPKDIYNNIDLVNLCKDLLPVINDSFIKK